MIEFDNVALKLGTQSFFFDFKIETGSLTMITGSSGSGKSTLLNLLAGFEQPESGSIFVNSDPMTDLSPGERPISLIFQENNLFSHLSVETNIALGIRPSLVLSQDEKRMISVALSDVGLAGFEKRFPSSLSGGERQRVAFARALVRKKPIIALDEPFAALDPGLRREMGQLLSDLHGRENNTVVMVTHNPDDVLKLASHVIFLDQGRVLFAGSITEFAAMNDRDEIAQFLNGSHLP